MLESTLRAGALVPFPVYIGERVYMAPIDLREPLPGSLARWQCTIDGITRELPAGLGRAYLMIDQSEVAPGQTQRRGGLHVDGNWIAAMGSHRGDGPIETHRHVPVAHHDHGSREPGRSHGSHHHGHSGYRPEYIVLASDVAACRAVVGRFEGAPKAGGDCAHLDVAHGREIALQAHRVYIGNVTLLHESLPLRQGGRRTVIRLNVPC